MLPAFRPPAGGSRALESRLSNPPAYRHWTICCTAPTKSALLVDLNEIVALKQCAYRDRLALNGVVNLEKLDVRHGV